MSDPKGGSANPPPSTPPPSTPPATPPSPNKTAQISIDQALAELETTKQDLKAAKDTIESLTTQLKAANDVLEAQTKAKLMSEILPRSKFSIEDLKDKNLEELEHMRATLDQAKLPSYKNIHFGPVGADEQGDQGLTAHRGLKVPETKRPTGRA